MKAGRDTAVERALSRSVLDKILTDSFKTDIANIS